jgi:hypothetical protein
MCVAQGVSPGDETMPPPSPCSAAEGGGTGGGENWDRQPRADALGYLYAAPSELTPHFS